MTTSASMGVICSVLIPLAGFEGMERGKGKEGRGKQTKERVKKVEGGERKGERRKKGI